MKKQILALLAVIILVPFNSYAQNSIKLFDGFENERLLEKNQKDTYSINLNEGEFIDMVLMQKGVDVVIDIYNPKGIKFKSLDTPNGRNGRELIQIEAKVKGVYKLEVKPINDRKGRRDSVYNISLEKNQGMYAITNVNILSAIELNQKLAKEKEKLARVKEKLDKKIQWIKSNAIPVKGLIAENGFEDLQPLKQILKNVKYVGLGEATHGTKEFFQMKHRMLEFLVKELGFTVFAIEASYSGGKIINDYILYGKGEVYSALANLGFWVWDTEEVIDMIEWMRRYNQSVSEENKIKFVGLDIDRDKQRGGISKIEEYLQKVDTLRFQEMKHILNNIESRPDSISKDSILSTYKNFLSFFVMSKGIFVQNSSEEEYETILEYIRVIGQYSDTYMMSKKDSRYRERNWRDYYMASNFFDMLANEKPGTKIVIWAHNGHVLHNTASNSGRVMQRPFGYYLKKTFEDKYYSFGFGFNKGSFYALEYDSMKKSKGLQKFIVSPAKKESIDWYFAQTNEPIFILNLKNKKIPEFMLNILDKPHYKREFGSVAYRHILNRYYFKKSLKSNYDGVIFINETSHSSPTETGMIKGD